jgi:hypothetical protein
MRTSEHGVLGLFQRGDGEFAADGWEVVEELAERLTSLEVVEEYLEGHVRADEHRRPTHDIRIAVMADVCVPMWCSWPEAYRQFKACA